MVFLVGIHTLDLGHVNLLASAFDTLSLLVLLRSIELRKVYLSDNLETRSRTAFFFVLLLFEVLLVLVVPYRLFELFLGRGICFWLWFGFRLLLWLFFRFFDLRFAYFRLRFWLRLGRGLDGLRYRLFLDRLRLDFRCSLDICFFRLLFFDGSGKTGVLDDSFFHRLIVIVFVVLLLAGILLDDFLHLDIHFFCVLLCAQIVAEFLFERRKIFVGYLGVRIEFYLQALLLEKVHESLKTDVELFCQFI